MVVPSRPERSDALAFFRAQFGLERLSAGMREAAVWSCVAHADTDRIIMKRWGLPSPAFCGELLQYPIFNRGKVFMPAPYEARFLLCTSYLTHDKHLPDRIWFLPSTRTDASYDQAVVSWATTLVLSLHPLSTHSGALSHTLTHTCTDTSTALVVF